MSNNTNRFELEDFLPFNSQQLADNNRRGTTWNPVNNAVHRASNQGSNNITNLNTTNNYRVSTISLAASSNANSNFSDSHSSQHTLPTSNPPTEPNDDIVHQQNLGPAEGQLENPNDGEIEPGVDATALENLLRELRLEDLLLRPIDSDIESFRNIQTPPHNSLETLALEVQSGKLNNGNIESEVDAVVIGNPIQQLIPENANQSLIDNPIEPPEQNVALNSRAGPLSEEDQPQQQTIDNDLESQINNHALLNTLHSVLQRIQSTTARLLRRCYGLFFLVVVFILII